MTSDFSTPAAPPASKPLTTLLTGPLAVALVLLVSYVLMLESVHDKSLTFDEPSHSVGGYAYWTLNDYRLDPEAGNLPNRVAALPLIFSSPKVDLPSLSRWPSSDGLRVGDEWLNRSNLDTASLVARGRATSALFAIALSLVVWLWSRQLFGPVGGMISLLACAFNPGVLANGPLMTSDMATMLFFTLALWRVSATLERITIGRVLGSILAVSGLLLSKMTGALIVPMTLLLVIARIVDGRPLPFSWRTLIRRSRQAGAIAFIALIHVFGVLFVVWGFYGFRYSAFSENVPGPAQFGMPWAAALSRPDVVTTITALNLSPAQQADANAIFAASGVNTPIWTYASVAAVEQIKNRVLTPDQVAKLDRLQNAPPDRLPARLVHHARNLALFPEAYLYGLASVSRLSETTPTFLNGTVSFSGLHSFFPFLFLVKSPLPLFALLLLAAAAWWYGRGASIPSSPTGPFLPNPLARFWPFLPLWILIIVYGVIAVTSTLNLGHRHLLPIYPPLFILGGAAARWFSFDPRIVLYRIGLSVRHLRFATLALTGLLVFEVAIRYPNYLAYFNGIISPSKAYLHVVDSSLDWGQELPAIARYLREHPNRPAYMGYLGMGRPSYYGITATQIGGHMGIDWKSDQPIALLANMSREEIDAYLRNSPQFDGDLRFEVTDNPARPVALFRRGSTLRLTGGIYVISATMLQPLYYGAPSGPWTVDQEVTYQQLRIAVEPMLSDDPVLRAQRLPQTKINEWATLYDRYITYRFARLTAYLRTREPDAQINYGILIYNLSDQDVAQALDGPAPPPET